MSNEEYYRLLDTCVRQAEEIGRLKRIIRTAEKQLTEGFCDMGYDLQMVTRVHKELSQAFSKEKSDNENE